MPDFHTNIEELKSAYFGTEHQFIEVTRVIPIDNNPLTFSPRLYSILGDTCSQVENLLRILCEKLEIPITEQPKFPELFEKLNVNEVLRIQRVALLIGKNAYEPFVIESDKKAPSWWRAYNETKHDLPKGYKKGNLGFTILALSAAFSLHCMAAHVRDYGKDVLLKENWDVIDALSVNTQSEFAAVGIEQLSHYIPKSKIFHCLSIFRDRMGAPV